MNIDRIPAANLPSVSCPNILLLFRDTTLRISNQIAQINIQSPFRQFRPIRGFIQCRYNCISHRIHVTNRYQPTPSALFQQLTRTARRAVGANDRTQDGHRPMLQLPPWTLLQIPITIKRSAFAINE